MRMELAHHLADDAGAFGEALVRIEPQQAHGVHDAAMDRLQSVAHVGQRPVHDGRQRIGQIALFQRLLQIDRFNVIAAAIFRRQNPFCHGLGLAERVIRGKRRVPDRSTCARLCNRKPQGRACRPTSICYMPHLLRSTITLDGPTFMPNSLHSPIAFGSGLPFTAIFDHCAGTRLFPVQFVTEW